MTPHALLDCSVHIHALKLGLPRPDPLPDQAQIGPRSLQGGQVPFEDMERPQSAQAGNTLGDDPGIGDFADQLQVGLEASQVRPQPVQGLGSVVAG